MSEAFNLDRKISMENMIDPTGKKWEIKGERGTALVQARPNPDRADAQIPDEFHGKWTSPTVLKERITVWLNKQWDKSDEAARLNALRAGRTSQSDLDLIGPGAHTAEPKQTPEESLASLDPEIAAELGDLIAVEPDYATIKWPELQKLAKEKGVQGRTKADLIEGLQALAGK